MEIWKFCKNKLGCLNLLHYTPKIHRIFLGKAQAYFLKCIHFIKLCSGRSRIFHLGGADLLGGVDFRHVFFSVKTCVKTKKLDPVGGACAGSTPLDPPMLCKYYSAPGSWK